VQTFSQIVVIINPVAGSGMGAAILPVAQEQLPKVFPHANIRFTETQNAMHAAVLGTITEADLIVVIGGDGTLHDVVQGVMRRPASTRPVVSLIAVGSGNDYARTIGIPQDPHEAIAALKHGVPAAVDVGRIVETNNKEATYYLETLSFGVDAAVAIRTMELRKTTGTKGLRLYARAAISAILHDLKPFHVSCRIDGQPLEDDLLICAVQNGPTYGSGFKVAPRARITDGHLNICLGQGMGTLRAMYCLTRIKAGTHESLKGFSTCEAACLEITLDRQVPIQCDGEELLGTAFYIEVVPAALKVLVPEDSSVLKNSSELKDSRDA